MAVTYRDIGFAIIAQPYWRIRGAVMLLGICGTVILCTAKLDMELG